ncbi:MAG: hypothetical protein F6K63_11955 [Moorea sp. SIO1G6]|uniref:hypothetical protein n=1 Tax=Moorena sp. SIO1G6 TaxID=2607840 RepID=UPI0013C0BF1F|nr:hypothetical protein [Moorena sp. SIO1G6]NET65055.1 hypothetical protein [Moorena sp. SIO1G6]
MKGKILNYLVLIGVSIILLLGIVTTAVGQYNSQSVNDSTIKGNNKNCKATNQVPVRRKKINDTNNSLYEFYDCMNPGEELENQGFFTDTHNTFMQYKVDGNYGFFINKEYLECSDQAKTFITRQR